ncbi:hypothetical protein PMAYCL1PPCAC_04191, partial [Pristionchus mayeri]
MDSGRRDSCRGPILRAQWASVYMVVYGRISFMMFWSYVITSSSCMVQEGIRGLLSSSPFSPLMIYPLSSSSISRTRRCDEQQRECSWRLSVTRWSSHSLSNLC